MLKTQFKFVNRNLLGKLYCNTLTHQKYSNRLSVFLLVVVDDSEMF